MCDFVSLRFLTKSSHIHINMYTAHNRHLHKGGAIEFWDIHKKSEIRTFHIEIDGTTPRRVMRNILKPL